MAKENIKVVSEVAKKKLYEAKKATGEFLPNDKRFPLSREFGNIPDDLDDLQNHGAYLEAAIKRMNKTDRRVFTEYDECLATIERLRKSIEEASKTREENNSNVDKLRSLSIVNSITTLSALYIIYFIYIICMYNVHL